MGYLLKNLYDIYPIRGAGEAATYAPIKVAQHAERANKLEHSFHKLAETNPALSDRIGEYAGAQKLRFAIFNQQGQINPEALARSFKAYEHALFESHKLKLEPNHLKAGLGLFERRVEQIRSASERVLVAGLACTGFAHAGVKVHLIADSEEYSSLVKQYLLPVFDKLNLSIGFVETGDSEGLRRRAYNSDVTILSSRECAMDFLRDAVNWPRRGNNAHRLIDRMMGKRANNKNKILQGLPSAIHLDAYSGLISNARAPIVLTQNAHPMHETEEIKRALELAKNLSVAKHYLFTGKELELEYTPEGKAQIDAWAAEIGEIWAVPSAADLMIAIAIVVDKLVVEDKHYVIQNGRLAWKVADKLVPGLVSYSKEFMTRVLEIKHDCSLTGEQEIVGRASYQHVFNRYIHLSGMTHSSYLINQELKEVYGLQCDIAPRATVGIRFDTSVLVDDDLQLINYLLEQLETHKSQALSMICVGSMGEGHQLQEGLQSQYQATKVIESSTELSEILVDAHDNLGRSIIVDAHLISTIPDDLWRSAQAEIHMYVCHRSLDGYQDSLLMGFDQSLVSGLTRSLQVLSVEANLFAEHPPVRLRKIEPYLLKLGSVGNACWKMLLEWQIRKRQQEVAAEGYRVRRNLLNHDKGIQSMLSFSGKGLYE